jgi:hypothetical protein
MTDKPKDTPDKTHDVTREETPHERVPEAAENIEHTLRRLVTEKEKKRAKNPGLYL